MISNNFKITITELLSHLVLEQNFRINFRSYKMNISNTRYFRYFLNVINFHRYLTKKNSCHYEKREEALFVTKYLPYSFKI